jgi:hypothetical protein
LENVASFLGLHGTGNMLFTETISGYCENRNKRRNTPGEQSKKLLNVKVAG